MPIGVPRIIYCWGEELPAQWTDIYNFIFRRRMVFLMQYLDDELCNQICGLLINIHMEDRSKDLEKKEMEKSGLFKSYSSTNQKKDTSKKDIPRPEKSGKAKLKSVEDLLTSDQDFAIDDNHMLEQYTLQKITTEWLNWNAQFFDYSDEPYLYYLAEILTKDFAGAAKDNANLKYANTNTTAKLISALKAIKNSPEAIKKGSKQNLDVYSPFRLLANFAPQNYNVENLNFKNTRETLNYNTQSAFLKDQINKEGESTRSLKMGKEAYLNAYLSQKQFTNKLQTPDSLVNLSEKALGQRRLKRQYMQERVNTNLLTTNNTTQAQKAYNYLDSNTLNAASYRKQTQQVMQEEESKKVFMIINSFGGSVGNGITVHDALQFIKAGSLTLALGVAASAASLALAGGTIGERYVTEGCHVMIHQPEGGINGQASDIWIDSQEIMKIRLDVAEIYSLATYRPRHKILRDLDRDFYLTAMETIYYGLADEIATNDVMHEIIEMTNKVWDYHDSKQQRLLESRDSQTSGLDTQTQN
jgi:ATP-dependent Clp protease, protease subunit